MDLSTKINQYCETKNSIVKDICKAFLILDIITAVVLYIIGSIVFIIEVL